MIEFILNNTTVKTHLPPGTPVLEVIRREALLTGTKLACGEGECGSCTILVGSLTNSGVQYQSMTSCITPLINVRNRHVVTIEGINAEALTPVQKALVDTNGTQCGFCTPGFVVSMTGSLLDQADFSTESIVTGMDGNICRCTGYKSIERAAAIVAQQFVRTEDRLLENLIQAGVVPSWFATIATRLAEIADRSLNQSPQSHSVMIGGGTDLYVQRPHEMYSSQMTPASEIPDLRVISIENGVCSIGAAATMSDLQRSTLLHKIFPGFPEYFAPIGSTQIRNMATVAGNLVNASPVGDLTIMFLALDSEIVLLKGAQRRHLKLRDFYLGYKQIDLTEGEYVERIQFNVPNEAIGFHFERVCKRTYLDVASVNSACMLEIDEDGIVQQVHLSAGGIAAIPLYLKDTCGFLWGKTLNTENIQMAVKHLQNEIAPISDIRGSADYKRLVLRQLFYAHMTELSGTRIVMQKLLPA